MNRRVTFATEESIESYGIFRPKKKSSMLKSGLTNLCVVNKLYPVNTCCIIHPAIFTLIGTN